MKRICSGAALALILVLTLAACGPKAPDGSSASIPDASASQSVPEGEPFVFTRDNLPRLDGSTSTAPLARAMCAVLLGEDQDKVADLIQFSRTTQSYRNLMAGDADLLLAAPIGQVLGQIKVR